MPLAVYVLGLSIFCMGTTEIMVSGLLPGLSADLGVSIPTAGLLISGFAVSMGVGAPVLSVALGRIARKQALVSLLTLFIAGQVLGAVAPNYAVLMVSRVVSALAMGGFFGIGVAVAVGIAGERARAKALSVMVGGLTVANVFGLPAATMIEQHLHWRASFAAVAIVSTLCLVAVIALLPRQDKPTGYSVRGELAAFTRPRLWGTLLGPALYAAAVMGTFAYFSPLLTEIAGLSAGSVPTLQFLFGIGSLVGITLGGRFADRHLLRTVCAGLAGLAVVLVALALLATNPVGVAVATLLFGVTAFGANPGLTARILRDGGDGVLVASSPTTAFNVGITIGPWAGGLAISSGWGYLGPVWISIGFAVACLIVVLAMELPAVSLLKARRGAPKVALGTPSAPNATVGAQPSPQK